MTRIGRGIINKVQGRDVHKIAVQVQEAGGYHGGNARAWAAGEGQKRAFDLPLFAEAAKREPKLVTDLVAVLRESTNSVVRHNIAKVLFASGVKLPGETITELYHIQGPRHDPAKAMLLNCLARDYPKDRLFMTVLRTEPSMLLKRVAAFAIGRSKNRAAIQEALEFAEAQKADAGRRMEWLAMIDLLNGRVTGKVAKDLQ